MHHPKDFVYVCRHLREFAANSFLFCDCHLSIGPYCVSRAVIFIPSWTEIPKAQTRGEQYLVSRAIKKQHFFTSNARA